MKGITIDYSAGRGKYGRQYAYIRPAGNCHNRSRRVRVDMIGSIIQKHFPEVHYYLVNGITIGAKNEDCALREYWRVCDRELIGKPAQITAL